MPGRPNLNWRRTLNGHLSHCRKEMERKSYKKRRVEERVDYNYDYMDDFVPNADNTDSLVTDNQSERSNCDSFVSEMDDNEMEFFNNYIINVEIYIFQLAILSKYSSNPTNISPFISKRGPWEDYVEINRFISSNYLSNRTGDELLTLIQHIAERHEVNIMLPTQFRTIADAVKKC